MKDSFDFDVMQAIQSIAQKEETICPQSNPTCHRIVMPCQEGERTMQLFQSYFQK